MVMCENNDQQDTCPDTRLSQSLDLGLLHKDESDMTGEGVGISQAEQASPGSKPSMLRRYRKRSHSVQPDNFLGVERLMGRRKSDSTSHKFAVDGKGTTTHKSSVLSENSTTSNRRGALTFEASALGPFSPRIMTRGHFGLKVEFSFVRCTYVHIQFKGEQESWRCNQSSPWLLQPILGLRGQCL